MKPKILAFGEIIWDVYADASFIGGAGLNFAAHCAKCGAESTLFSAVGKDTLGKNAYAEIANFGLSAEMIKQSEQLTGQCAVTLKADGTPEFNVAENTAYDNIEVTDEDIRRINDLGYDALYFGTLIQRSGVSQSSLRKICEECTFSEIVCDINLRKNCYSTETAEYCLKHATILKISDEEEPLLRTLGLYAPAADSPESVAEAICEKYGNIRYIIFTLGGKGALTYCAENRKFFAAAAESVTVKSTVGAGDSFIAAWITAFLGGESAETATKRAVRLSGFVVSSAEAIPNYTFPVGDSFPISADAVFYDMHTHSQNSHDGNFSVCDMAKACIAHNIKAFAVTDHCDIEYYTERNMLDCIKSSIAETENAAKQFGGEIEILKGVEIGEGIWNLTHTEEVLSQTDYDVIIASVHAVRYKDYTDPYSTIDFSKMTAEDIDGYLDKYFDEVLETLHRVPCNIMAHLTCPLRYIRGKYKINADSARYSEKIEQILKYIIEKSIALEINTSGVNTFGFFMPDEWIIKRYKELGGELVTLGSDAHIPENVGTAFESAVRILKKYRFECYYRYRGGKPVRCEL